MIKYWISLVFNAYDLSIITINLVLDFPEVKGQFEKLNIHTVNVWCGIHDTTLTFPNLIIHVIASALLRYASRMITLRAYSNDLDRTRLLANNIGACLVQMLILRGLHIALEGLYSLFILHHLSLVIQLDNINEIS